MGLLRAFFPSKHRNNKRRTRAEQERANHAARYPAMQLHPAANKRNLMHWRRVPRSYGTTSIDYGEN